jgi:hypothetical protein
VAAALKAHNNSPAVAAAALGAIQYLVFSDANRVRLGDAGACEAVVGATKANRLNEGTALAACHAMHNLALNDVNRRKLSAAGASEVLATLMQEYSNSTEVLPLARRVLDRLAHHNTTSLS